MPEWKQENFTCKLTICQKENFNDLSDQKQKLTNFDIFICTLGIRVNRGEKEFLQVDYDYVLKSA